MFSDRRCVQEAQILSDVEWNKVERDAVRTNSGIISHAQVSMAPISLVVIGKVLMAHTRNSWPKVSLLSHTTCQVSCHCRKVRCANSLLVTPSLTTHIVGHPQGLCRTRQYIPTSASLGAQALYESVHPAPIARYAEPRTSLPTTLGGHIHILPTCLPGCLTFVIFSITSQLQVDDHDHCHCSE